MASQALSLGFLGAIEVARDGAQVALPPSKKTRALLAYLAVTGRAHRRERLCDLLWDLPDDPRGALRWSLSKLRPLVDAPGRPRIRADRDMVALDLTGVAVDLLDVRAELAGDIDALASERLIEAAERFRGEFLEGLELASAPAFHGWCVAEREEARLLHVKLLRALLRRLSGEPERALPFARALVQADAFDHAARAGLIGLLAASGRMTEAERQFELGMRLAKEVGEEGGSLVAAWRDARQRRASAGPAARLAAPVVAPRLEAPGTARPPAPPLVGREQEQARLAAALDAAAVGGGARVLLLSGEPGVGKSRLLAELALRARQRRATVLVGTAYEAEGGRPYGPWIDALRGGAPVGADLAPLLFELAGAPAPGWSRERLFAAVVEHVAGAARSAPPVLLALDDAQWCDEASATLLHHVVRLSRDLPLVVLLAAREGELPDNPPMQRVLHSLRRERTLEELALAPLAAEALRRLVAEVAPAVDAARVLAESGGNPLFALELARGLDESGGEVPQTLFELVRARIDRLAVAAQAALRWCAVLGPTFAIADLEALSGLDLATLMAALETLERHALLREAGDGAAYAFAHDLVRRVVYAELSEPRRRLMHLRVARQIERQGAAETAGDLARHAALAGEPGMAAAACVAAGRHCLRVFAHEEARALARRGLHHAQGLREPERTRLRLELMEVSLAAHRPEDASAAAARLEELASRALDHGCLEHARLGFHLLAYLRWEGGAWSDAQRYMMQAEGIGRSGDERERALALAEAALCLALLERDLGAAEALLLESEALAARLGLEPIAIPQAAGMLRLYRGALDEAAALFGRARALARREGSRLREFQALEHLVMLEIERGDAARAGSLAGELVALAARLPDGSEAPFARALAALIDHAQGEAAAELAAALDGLRLADAKHRLAYVLNRAALIELGRGEVTVATARAAEALRLALVLGGSSEAALARLVLAGAAAAREDGEAMAAELLALQALPLHELAASVRARLEALPAAGAARLAAG